MTGRSRRAGAVGCEGRGLDRGPERGRQGAFLEAALEAAQLEVEQASAAIADGYAAEDERAVTQARKTEEAAVADVRELQR